MQIDLNEAESSKRADKGAGQVFIKCLQISERQL